MKQDKRIWKTAVLAVAVTLIFGVFVFNFEEWTRDNSEFVSAQATGAGVDSAAGPTVTRVIPQIAAGSYDGGITKYITVIQIVNTGSNAINVSGNFYNTDGSVSTLALTSNLLNNSFTGVLGATQLVGGGVMTITAANAAAGTINWGRIVTTGAAAISAYFEMRGGATNILYNRTGISGSLATMSRFVIPRVRNVASRLDVGFALVNTGSTPADITLTARDSAGSMLGARTFNLDAGNQMSGFPFQLLAAGQGCSPCLQMEGSGTTHGYLSFESTSAAFASTALAIEGGAQSSFPIEVLQ